MGKPDTEESNGSSALIHLYSYDPESRIGTLELLCSQDSPDGIHRFREIHRERGYTRR